MQPLLGGACRPVVPCGLAAVLGCRGAVLGAAVGLAEVLGTGLSGLVCQGELGVTGAGAAVGPTAVLVTSKIQSRSRVTRV